MNYEKNNIVIPNTYKDTLLYALNSGLSKMEERLNTIQKEKEVKDDPDTTNDVKELMNLIDKENEKNEEYLKQELLRLYQLREMIK
ncbi:hypothetical protein PP175_29510 (plasmid) [Aneurinibacillus sp. Ricciae_BoGa-3]|uniref:hypothetical protein n=1 Tax=Aneurinibacillus sp. Ricciae_BoGa-3 TaxID=3022697 RepID=UPI0023410416|nr:hypothetical protein [Aneurinibacillus sp. Ricciae_BoGa-3]WCK57330.1 hypothetical protein PP175_29510 [Aneurinibacillus sp. Ricciae_BoGa-3]